LPKVEICVWVNDQSANDVAERITKAARTGRMGDGKILIVDIGWPEVIEF
jgi:nitrogen regulatory protein PII